MIPISELERLKKEYEKHDWKEAGIILELIDQIVKLQAENNELRKIKEQYEKLTIM